MATVTAEIKRILKMKDAGILSGSESIKKLLIELQKQVQFNIHLGTDWDKYYLKKLLDSIEFQVANFDAKAKAEISGQLESVWGAGQNLVDLPLRKAGIYFGMPQISTSVLDTMRNFAFHKIESMSTDAWMKIKGELTLGALGGKTPAEVTKAIGANLKDPGIFKSVAERAEVITQTEMGRVFSTATRKRIEMASQYVPGLQKQWKHAGHPMKARPTHLAAHGAVVDADKPFPIQDKNGYQLMQPRDSAADISETIRCGCDMQPYMRKWAA